MNIQAKIITILVACATSFTTHAADLGQIHVTDAVLGSRMLTYEKINNYAVVEGDILLAKVSDLNTKGAIITHQLGGSRWPNNTIPFEVDELLPFQNKLSVYQAINNLQQHTYLVFVELNSNNRERYTDYISFIPASGTTCSSYVGRQKGPQAINLSPRCTIMNTVHEIGHALGLWHEQSRADRDAFVHIAWENIEEDHKFNFNQHLSDGIDFGEYDYQSIMHYGAYAFSKNGEKTIISLVDGVEIGQRNQLSPKDIAALEHMYPEN